MNDTVKMIFGLMSLPQAISVIFGANIVTTMTAQLMAFKITDYIYPIISIGFLMNFLSREQRGKDLGTVVFSFGLLFEGIDIMGSVMKPLAVSPVFTDLMGKVSAFPVLGILLGDNIGTTITALLASIGQSRDAKRTALAHSFFNISGSIVFACIIPAFARFVTFISPKGPEIQVISRQIANAHTTFNVVCTLVWLPLIPLMVKLVTFVVPGKEKTAAQAKTLGKPHFLDDKMLGQPVPAMYLVSKEIDRCAGFASGMIEKLFDQAIDSVRSGDTALAKGVVQNKGRMQKAQKKFNKANLARVKKKKCDASLTQDYTSILYGLERMADSCSGIAEEVMDHVRFVSLKDAEADISKANG